VSLDVLEHIEPECLDDVLDDMKRCTLKGVFLSVSLVTAGKTLPDGRNAHLIVEPIEWWLPKLMARWDLMSVQKREHVDFIFVGRQLEMANAEREADAKERARILSE
jgi:hypothetical protein